jgi:uncharacterized protein YndB with AHSA1/START domain
MSANHFTLRFSVDQTPREVFDAINNVREWWSEDFKGTSHDQGDEFEVRFGHVHYSRHKLEEIVPGEKIVWLVTDSHLSFLTNKSEWTGTKMIFEIGMQGDQTEICFMHLGLVPAVECYKDCVNGWTQYLLKSLQHYITTGTGAPNVLNKEIAQKAETIHTHN